MFSSSLNGGGSLAAGLLQQDSKETVMRGELLKAFQSAYTAFSRSKSFPHDKKNIANYDVQFTETAETIVVFFAPRRKPGERPILGGATSLGFMVRVVVSKENYRVLDMKGFK
jgi:hypothetical protein